MVELDLLFGQWVKDCEVGEVFGDYVVCVGVVKLVVDFVWDFYDE